MSNNEKSLNRRQVTKLGAAAIAAAATGASQMASAQTAASELESTFLMELALDVADQSGAGTTAMARFPRGRPGGPRCRGRERDGGERGSAWALRRSCWEVCRDR